MGGARPHLPHMSHTGPVSRGVSQARGLLMKKLDSQLCGGGKGDSYFCPLWPWKCVCLSYIDSSTSRGPRLGKQEFAEKLEVVSQLKGAIR